MAAIDMLVPGVSTVTRYARYFALYWAVAAHATHVDLDRDACRRLIRRVEVGLARISAEHDDPNEPPGLGHGVEAYQRLAPDPGHEFGIADATGSASYSPRTWGFWSQYNGPSVALGTVAIDSGALRVGRHRCPDAVTEYCELAILAPQPKTLFPEGTRESASTMRTLARNPVSSATAACHAPPVLLGCVLLNGTLVVELVPAHTPVTVETSPSGAPGTWLAAGIAPPGQGEARFLVPELTGGAVRAAVQVNGSRRESAVVFITDPARCRPRREAADEARLTRSYHPEEIFTDPVIAQRFTADLIRLVEQSGVATSTAVGASRTAVDEQVEPVDRWADFLEACDRVLGPDLSRLVFPRNATPEAGISTAWSIDDADHGELSEGEDEAVLDTVGAAEPAATVRIPVIRPDERARYRLFAARWVATVTGSGAAGQRTSAAPVPLRMTVATLYLTLMAAGIWQDTDDWREDLRRLIVILVPTDDTLDELPPEAFDRLYAVLAVAMATLLQGAQLHGGRAVDNPATAAWQDAAEWVAEADTDLAEELLLPATQAYARTVTNAELWDTITLARQARQDPYAEPRMVLARAGMTVNAHNGVWHVEGIAANPYRAAAQAATELRRVSDQAVVIARTPRQAVLVAVAGRVMAMADSRTVVWRLYELSSTRTPASLVAGCVGPPPGAKTFRQVPSPPEVRHLSDTLGVDVSGLAREIRAR